MSILENYSRCLMAGDAARMAALFAEDGEFRDEAPAKMGLNTVVVNGRQGIEDFFSRTFKRGGMSVSNVGINGDAMRYDVAVGKVVLLCLGVAEVEGGLIKRYRVIAV